jgi:uncharacterized membrane protein
MMTFQTTTRWLLPASLLVNAFLIGALAAPLILHPFGHPFGPPGPMHGLEEGLDSKDRDAIHKAFDGQHADMEKSRAAFETAQEHIHAILAAPTLDVEALKSALQEIRAAHALGDDSMAAAVLAAAQTVSPDGRKHLAAHNPPPPGGPHGPGFGPDGPPMPHP